jgi:hypothetical protein
MERGIIKIYISILSLFFLVPLISSAGPLSYISDTLWTSAAATSSSHIIQFTSSSGVPPLGKIVYIPSDGDFTIPGSISVYDIDFQYAPTTTGEFTDRLVGTTSSPTTDVATFTTGTSGNVTIQMNSSFGIDPGVQVRILIGSNARYGDGANVATGTVDIINPSATSSYQQVVTTFDESDQIIDQGITAIAIVDQVGVGPVDTTETIPPVISNGHPEGEIAYDTTVAELSVNTDEFSTCRYSSSAGVDYESMANQFPNTGIISHSGAIISGLVGDTTYTFYVRCEDDEGNQNIEDYIIEFYWGPPPGDGGTGPGGGGGSGGGSGNDTGTGTGGGGGGGGGPAPFPPTGASVRFEGVAYPESTIVVLQDGGIIRQISLGSDGVFDTTLTNIPYGTYTFGIYAIDADNYKSSTFNSTFSLVGGTGNTLSDIFISPTIELDSDRVSPGGILGISGTAIANSTVEIWTHRQKPSIADSEITKIIALVDDEGRWSSVINTAGFLRDTHQVKVKSIFDNGDESYFSDYKFYGVGVNPNPVSFLTADLNRDGFVNIIDFSILLFHWGTNGGNADPPPDINQDGNVSLTDFSIMLFQWTG